MTRHLAVLSILALAAATGQTIKTPPTAMRALRLESGVQVERIVPATASLVFGINLQKLRDSGAMQMAMDRLGSLGASIPQAGIPDWNRSVALLNDLDGLLLALSGTPDTPEPLALVTGRFQNPMWAQNKILTPAQLAASNAILAGTPAGISSAVARLQSKASAGSSMTVRAAAFGARYDIWLIADNPAVVSQIGRKLPAGIDVSAAQVRGLEFGLSIHEKGEMLITLITASKDAADKLETALKKQATTAKQDFTVQRFNTAVRVYVSVDPKNLQALMPAQEKPSEHPGKVMIYGLEDKPKTVTIK